MQLFIDDGVQSRGHRKNLFSTAMTMTGGFTGPHSAYGFVSCMTYAGEYENYTEEELAEAKRIDAEKAEAYRLAVEAAEKIEAARYEAERARYEAIQAEAKRRAEEEEEAARK